MLVGDVNPKYYHDYVDGYRVLIYVSELRISRLMLVETICGWYCISGQISIYKGDAAEIFKKLEIIMIICWFKRMFMIIEDIRYVGPLQ